MLTFNHWTSVFKYLCVLAIHVVVMIALYWCDNKYFVLNWTRVLLAIDKIAYRRNKIESETKFQTQQALVSVAIMRIDFRLDKFHVKLNRENGTTWEVIKPACTCSKVCACAMPCPSLERTHRLPAQLNTFAHIERHTEAPPAGSSTRFPCSWLISFLAREKIGYYNEVTWMRDGVGNARHNATDCLIGSRRGLSFWLTRDVNVARLCGFIVLLSRLVYGAHRCTLLG